MSTSVVTVAPHFGPVFRVVLTPSSSRQDVWTAMLLRSLSLVQSSLRLGSQTGLKVLKEQCSLKRDLSPRHNRCAVEVRMNQMFRPLCELPRSWLRYIDEALNPNQSDQALKATPQNGKYAMICIAVAMNRSAERVSHVNLANGAEQLLSKLATTSSFAVART